MSKNQPRPKLNPALKALKGFVGDWEMEISAASFLPDPSAAFHGHTSFQWSEYGACLVMRQGNEPPRPPSAIWIIGRDESAPNYKILYFDSRGVSRIYEMSFNLGVWKIWRDSPGFSQRFEGKFSDDGKTITANWQKSFDGKNWEHDFNLTYKKIEKRK